MNPITNRINTGVTGELLVQLRLLENGVQAAPPLADSGNDLIAIRGEVFRAVQVKTTTREVFTKGNLPEHYHILAVVQLQSDEDKLYLDRSRVFLIARDEVDGLSTHIDNLEDFLLTPPLVDKLFTL